MNLYTKLLLFYVGLNAREQTQFSAILGNSKLKEMYSKADTSFINTILDNVDNLNGNRIREREDIDYDVAIMQVVRHIVNITESNLELAKSVESITGKKISRADKRSQYELQGMLLGALIDAPKEKLSDIKNQLVYKTTKSKASKKSKTNLDKWFSIILGNK